MRTANVDFVVRSMSRKDIPLAERLDSLCHSQAWGLQDFQRARKFRGGVILSALLPLPDGKAEFVGFSFATVEEESVCFHRLAVHPEWQRCGIGCGLYDVTLQIAREWEPNCTHVMAAVHIDSPAHVRFWASLGLAKDKAAEEIWHNS